MNLTELYAALSFGHLSNLSMSNEGNGTIKETSKGKIVFHTNNALSSIYGRFILKENEQLIALVSQQSLYDMNPSCLKVLRAFAECGFELGLNDENDNSSVFTPKDQVIQIPTTKLTQPGMKVAVIYQVKHPKLLITNPDDQIIIPSILDEALTAYVASKVYSDMTGQDNLVKSQELMTQYETVCQNIIDKDLLSQSISTTIIRNFERKGFV